MCRSLWHTPQPVTLTRTSVPCGLGVGRSRGSSGLPHSTICMLCMASSPDEYPGGFPDHAHERRAALIIPMELRAALAQLRLHQLGKARIGRGLEVLLVEPG